MLPPHPHPIPYCSPSGEMQAERKNEKCSGTGRCRTAVQMFVVCFHLQSGGRVLITIIIQRKAQTHTSMHACTHTYIHAFIQERVHTHTRLRSI